MAWNSWRVPSAFTLALLWVVACDGQDPASDGDAVSTDEPVRPIAEITDIAPGSASMRRLTRAQYVASVRAAFGEDLAVLPPTEVDIRTEGLLTVGAREANVTPAGIEGYEASARTIAAEVMSPAWRDDVVGCDPAYPSEPDDACAREFVRWMGPLLLRRLLVPEEEEAYVELAGVATETLGDFHRGLEAVIVTWLLNPEFLYIQEIAQPTVEGEGGQRLTGLSLASRLSYFLWAQGPDRELLAAAAAGDLGDEAGYQAQVERLVADQERLERGLRLFFSDLYDLDELDHVQKDPDSFPELTAGALEDAREQTLRTIMDHLLVQGADFRDLFTTRKTFMTRRLGPIYGVPVAEEWEDREFPESGARAGILTQVSLLALNARTSRSSPVLRGEFVLDKVLCQTISPPPGDVSFDTVAPSNANAPTARERLMAHQVNPSCNGCHSLMDPIGLAFENFDAIGRYRTKEQGEDILTYGELGGVSYDDIRGFHTALRDAPAVPRCLVRKLFMHSVGRVPVAEEDELLASLNQAFAANGHALVPLMKTIASSYGFRATSGPAEALPTEEP